MTARRYQDLVVWQAADALRREVYRLTNNGPSIGDFRFRDQIRAAAAGIAANIAEGYRRYGPKDFVKFLDYAYSSAGETANWLDDGIARGHWSEDDLEMARRQLRRLDAGLRSLMRYLRTQRAASNAGFARRTLAAAAEPPSQRNEPPAKSDEPPAKPAEPPAKKPEPPAKQFERS